MSKPVEVRTPQRSDLPGLLALYDQLIENDLPLSPVTPPARS